MADQTTTVTNGNEWLQPYWQQWLTNLQNITPSSMPVYNGPTVAPQNQNQLTSYDMMSQFAQNGTAASNAAKDAITGIANGSNVNPYMGVNPYTQQVIDSTNKNMTDAYARGTAAQTDAAMARQGAYGGSAYNELTSANNQALANAIGNVDSGLLNQNYYNNANMYQQGVQNQLNAANLGLGSQSYDLAAINGLNQAGNQQQGYTQNVLGGMQDLFNRTTQAPFTSSAILGSGLSQASGAPTSQTTTVNGPGQSPWSFLGPILSGIGLFG